MVPHVFHQEATVSVVFKKIFLDHRTVFILNELRIRAGDGISGSGLYTVYTLQSLNLHLRVQQQTVFIHKGF